MEGFKSGGKIFQSYANTLNNVAFQALWLMNGSVGNTLE